MLTKYRKGLVLLLMLLGAGWATAGALPDQPHVVVSAEGEVEAAPDIAHFNLQISETRDTATAAKAEVDRRTELVLNAAREQGINDEDIRSSQVRVYPDYDWQEGKRILRGQRVERSVELKLTDLGRYGALLDGLVLAGITELGQIQLDLSNRKELVAKAMQKAVAQAKTKAELLAKGFGRNVAEVYHIDESGGNVVVAERQYAMMDAKAVSAAPVLFGKQTVAVQLKAVFLLE